MADAEGVAAWLQRRRNPAFAEAFGNDCGRIGSFVADACLKFAGSAVLSVKFHMGQVVVACVELADASRYALKLYPEGYESLDVLVAARTVQAHLAARGLPVPEPLRLERVGSVIVALDEFREGERRAWSSDGFVTDMAHGLAVLAEEMPPLDVSAALRGSRLEDHPQTRAGEAPPDDLRDELASCLSIVDAGADVPTVAFLDWRTQNIAWHEGRIAAIYDWDSVAISSESRAVGAAAGMFTYDFRDTTPHVPTPAEVDGFIAAYADEQRINEGIARAAAGVKMLAYAATEQMLDPAGTRLGPRSFRSALIASLSDYSAVFRP